MLSYCGLWNRVAALKGGSSRCIRGGGVSRVFQHHPSSVQHTRRREKDSNIILWSGVAFSWLTYNKISNHVASASKCWSLLIKVKVFIFCRLLCNTIPLCGAPVYKQNYSNVPTWGKSGCTEPHSSSWWCSYGCMGSAHGSFQTTSLWSV